MAQAMKSSAGYQQDLHYTHISKSTQKVGTTLIPQNIHIISLRYRTASTYFDY